jgi:hypothetical protein
MTIDSRVSTALALTRVRARVTTSYMGDVRGLARVIAR